MANFAQINDDDIVINVIVVGDNDCLDENGQVSEQVGIDFCRSILGQDTNWLQTGEGIRKNPASHGFFYDRQRDAFIPPKPFESWIFNEETCNWDPPYPIPSTEVCYYWNEEDKSWTYCGD